MAVITMNEVLGMLMGKPNGDRLVKVATSVGKAVQAEANLLKVRKDNPQNWKRYLQSINNGLTLSKVNQFARKSLESGDWSNDVQVRLL